VIQDDLVGAAPDKLQNGAAFFVLA